MAASSWSMMQQLMPSGQQFVTDFEQIKTFSASEFNQWVVMIAEASFKVFSDIKQSWKISECRCPGSIAWGAVGGPHSRKNPLELRNKLETTIEKACEGVGKDEPINLLSIGSGQLYQELVILARLWVKGYRQIHLYSVDDDSDFAEKNINARKQFAKLIEVFNQQGASFNFSSSATLSDVPETVRFDVVYAVDFDDAGMAMATEYANRNIPRGISGIKGDKNYEIVRLMINAANRMKDNEHSLFWLSSGKLVHAFNREGNLYPERRYYDFTLSQDMKPSFYYINANPLYVLYYLHQLIQTDCQVIINEAILDDNMKQAITQLLSRYDLQQKVMILPEPTARQILDTGMTLVLDCTLADENCGVELIDDHVFFAKGSFVVRQSYQDLQTMGSTSLNAQIHIYPDSHMDMLAFEFLHYFQKQPPEMQMALIGHFLMEPYQAISEHINLIRSISMTELNQDQVEQLKKGICKKTLESLPKFLAENNQTLPDELNDRLEALIIEYGITPFIAVKKQEPAKQMININGVDYEADDPNIPCSIQ